MVEELGSRRDFLKKLGVFSVAAGMYPAISRAESVVKKENSRKQPNIIVVMTDDQGYGDVGFHGNKLLKTPNIDQFAQEGMELTRFYVAPVCSPTRAGLLTGRYHYRTGVTNVGSCGDRIKEREVTVAKILSDAGYNTAVYGKWHIGDNYPMRPQDKGFNDVVVHRGCCLTPWFRNDPPGENYYDPFLYHNGVKKQYKGYCMDVYTDLTLDFAAKNSNEDKPFFVYLSTNTPHGPLSVANEYSQPYKDAGASDHDAEFYGTITNIDYNVGRLVDGVKELGIDGETMIIFFTDNGNASGTLVDWAENWRGKKSTVYEGGIRVPCLVRWPGVVEAGSKSNNIASYVDLLPTFMDIAGVAQNDENPKLDGETILPIIAGVKEELEDRDIIIQWHQGLTPQLYRSFTVINQKYKLVQSEGGFHRSGKFLTGQYKYELFDIDNDHLETNDLAAKYPDIVKEMKAKYEDWFYDVMRDRGPDPQEIYIGSPEENPVILSPSASFVEQDEVPNFITGEWPARVVETGKYDIKIHFDKGVKASGELNFRFGDTKLTKKVRKKSKSHEFENVTLEKGSYWLYCMVHMNNAKQIPTYMEITSKNI
jgi:arylsulfatase A-like enzyme